VTLKYRDHIGWKWNSSKIISQLVSFGVRSPQTPTSRIHSKGNTRNFGRNKGGIRKSGFSAYKSSDISETRQDIITKITIEDHQEVQYAL